jgi:Ca-activated chloride channel family protein
VGFGFPEAFLFLLILPPLLWVLWRGEKRSNEIIKIFKYRSFGKWHIRSRLILIALFIVSLVAVGAKPYKESRDTGSFLFLVDVTRSMNARYSCSEPTYLDRTKIVMREVISEIPEARFGIIAFDRLAFPITQITYDHDYLNQVIEYGLHIGLTYDATATNIANALSVVAGKKQRLPELYSDVSYVILLSDGKLDGDYQTRLRVPFSELEKSDIRIVSVGIGNSGETPIPMTTSGGDCRGDNYTDIEGNTILVQLRDDILALISAGSQGEYFGEAQTDELIEYLRENGLEEMDVELEVNKNQRRDISKYFLMIALLSLLGMLIIKTFQLTSK